VTATTCVDIMAVVGAYARSVKSLAPLLKTAAHLYGAPDTAGYSTDGSSVVHAVYAGLSPRRPLDTGDPWLRQEEVAHAQR
jgi:hypothetical protein